MNKKQQIPYPQKDRWSYLWLVLGTIIGFLWTMPIVWWLSPVFLLRFSRSQKVWRAFLLIWLTSFITTSYVMYEMMSVLMPTSLPVYLISMAFTALLIGGLPYLADRLMVSRFKGFAATLIFPLAVTILDYFSGKTNPLGSLGGQAYNQYGNLVLLQLASFTGMWGIVFLVNWFGSVINWGWEREFDWPQIRRGALTFTGIMLAVLLYGSARLAYGATATETVRMHGITEVDMRNEVHPQLLEARREDHELYRQLSADLQDTYFEATVREARAGAELVHWPEMAVHLATEDEAAFLARGQQIARDEGIYLAMAYAIEYPDSPFEQKLAIIDPAGEVALEHYKYGGASLEGFRSGDGILRTVETPFGMLSGIICNDTNHEEIVNQAGRNGTDILLSPSLELRVIDPIHAHMAVMRAIENGVTLVRQADNGLSFVADPYGRIIAEADFFDSSSRTMVAQVPAHSGVFTVYGYIGDAFAWLAMAVFATMVVLAVVQARREKQAKPAAPEGPIPAQA